MRTVSNPSMIFSTGMGNITPIACMTLPAPLGELQPSCHFGDQPPAPAITNIGAVEILKLWILSPPVPTISNISACSCFGSSALTPKDRITCKATVISSILLPFICKAIKIARNNKCAIFARKSDPFLYKLAITFASASTGFIKSFIG